MPEKNGKFREPPALSCYEAMAETYAAAVDTKPHNAYYERPAVLSLLPPPAGLRVLDAGCGSGWYAEYLADRQAAVTAVDVSPKLAALTRERLGGRPAERPGIAKRVTVVWIAGGASPEGGWECNLLNDIDAANVVLEAEAPFWQIPCNVYSRMKANLAELRTRMKSCGAIGGYSYDQLVETNDRYGGNPKWPPEESWVLGDSAGVGVLLDEHAEGCVRRSAPAIGNDMRYLPGRRSGKIRVYRRVDARFILEDFCSKLALHARQAETRTS